jgi:hypothetical protein
MRTIFISYFPDIPPVTNQVLRRAVSNVLIESHFGDSLVARLLNLNFLQTTNLSIFKGLSETAITIARYSLR